MKNRLLICTDLDRTLIPNGPQLESPGARKHFSTLVARPEVTLAYVSGRHRALVEQAIGDFHLPIPDFVIGDVGTTIYHVWPERQWQRQKAWEAEIAEDWNGYSRTDLEGLLQNLTELKLQEHSKQNDYKLSYYVSLDGDRDAVSEMIQDRLGEVGAESRLIWSVDDLQGIGLLDIVPARASKLHAIEALMKLHGFCYETSVFCGDSGNDIEVLASPVPAVLVANSRPDVRKLARRLADEMGHSDRLYIACGDFMGMNGNYSGGMLEGIAHYHPRTLSWMAFEREVSEA